MQDVAYYDEIVADAAARHDVPAAFIKAIIGAESSYQIPAINRWEPAAGEYAYGPMQILLSTARQFAPGITGPELERPYTNIDVGAAFVRDLMNRFGVETDFRRIYSAYNSGRPDRWETSDQVRSNVERAIGWLERFTTETIAAAGATVSENPAGLFLAGALLLLILMKRRS